MIRKKLKFYKFNKVFQKVRNKMLNNHKRLVAIIKGEKCKVLYCIGDSHIMVFDYLSNENYMSRTIIKTIRVDGATALGMANPNSKTNALQVFKEKILRIPKNEYLIFMLGEVDCGFVIWYRSNKYNMSVEEQMIISLENYFNFLLDIKGRGYQNIIVCTAHLPTIKDGQDWGEVANLRKEVKVSLKERTNLTLKYNLKLKEFCKVNGFYLIDIVPDIINNTKGVIDSKFLNKNPLDHHLESSMIAPIYTNQLYDLGFK